MTEANEAKSALRYPYDEHPAAGTIQEVAPGVHWLTMPMPGSLSAINLYLLEDKEGWWIVDTGLTNDETESWWREIFANALGNKPVVGVICTHMHPDHIGQANMITETFRCPLYMTRTEYYQARSFSNSGPGSSHSSWMGTDFYIRAGMPADYLEQLAKAWESRSADSMTMPTMPAGYERLSDGQVLTHRRTRLAGGRRFRAFAGTRVPVLRRAQGHDLRGPDPAHHHVQRERASHRTEREPAARLDGLSR